MESGPLQLLLGQPRWRQRAAEGATHPPQGGRVPAAAGGAAVLLRGGGHHDAAVQGGGQLLGAALPGLLAGGEMLHQDL